MRRPPRSRGRHPSRDRACPRRRRSRDAPARWRPLGRSRGSHPSPLPYPTAPSLLQVLARHVRSSHGGGGMLRGHRYAAYVLPDYAAHEQAIGLDWYALDPNLRGLLDRLLPDPEDRAFAEDHVARYGNLCGGPLAARAEVSDKRGPMLERYDQWGREVNEIVHHPSWLA